MFNVPQTDGDAFGNPLSTWIYGAAMIAIVLICCAIMYWRYVPED
jgi:hypothetical protein